VYVAQEQQRARPQVAKPRRDVRRRTRVFRFQGKDDLGLVSRACRTRQPLREDVVLDGEVLVARVNFRKIGDGVDGLEAEAEAPDGRLVLGALGNVADATDVGLVEWLAKMREHKAGRVQGERNLA